MKYNAALDYEVGNEITYSGSKYRCIQANGPASSVKAPTDTSYWEKLVNTPGAVLYNQAQSLSSAQKQQARDNIGAISSAPSIEAVLYGQNQNLTAAQKQTARTNIGAMDAATYYGKTLAADSDNVYLQDQGGSIISTLALRSNLLTTIDRNANPPSMEILWSGDLNYGDITLTYAFTDYDAIMCIYGTDDHSPGSHHYWRYAVVPVWFLKKCIIDKSLFGLTIAYVNILGQGDGHWTISTADSSSTLLKHAGDSGIHMWRIIGIRLTSAAI
ncbi:MAG: hypothetical protein VZR73_14110 [Acutalibacteraceae bacterium]|nr:hypothetical protein [Acutalibacteraceae bacterium]